jgi:hypothetical protein
MAFQLGLELINQANGMQVLRQCEAPRRQQATGINEVQMAHTRVVMVAKLQTGTQWPLLPLGFFACPAQNALIGHDDQTRYEIQMNVEVNLQRRQNVLLSVEF